MQTPSHLICILFFWSNTKSPDAAAKNFQKITFENIINKLKITKIVMYFTKRSLCARSSDGKSDGKYNNAIGNIRFTFSGDFPCKVTANFTLKNKA